MGLIVPLVPNDRDPTNPFVNAYCEAVFFSVDKTTGQGKVEFAVYVSKAAADAKANPIARVGLAFGEKIGDAVVPTVGSVVQQPKVAASYGDLNDSFEQLGVAFIPLLAGATKA